MLFPRDGDEPVEQLEFDFGTVAFSDYDEDDFLGFSADLPGAEGGAPPAEALSPYGLRSRPRDPETDPEGLIGIGCGMLYVRNGDHRHAMALEDPRDTSLPALRKGETMLYAAPGQFVRLHEDGAITLFTTDEGGAPTGRSVFLQVAPDALRFNSPWGVLTFDAAGFHVKTHSGARVDLGGVEVEGVPFPGGSYAKVQAGVVDVKGSAVAIGGGGETHALAHAAPLISLLTRLLEILGTAATVSGGAFKPDTLAALANLAGELQTIIASATST